VQAVSLLWAACHQGNQGVWEPLVHPVDDGVGLRDAGEEVELWWLLGLREGNARKAKLKSIVYMVVKKIRDQNVEDLN
jgi:hypothetical protein